MKCIACDGEMVLDGALLTYSCSNKACAMQRVPAEQQNRIEAFREKHAPAKTEPESEKA